MLVKVCRSVRDYRTINLDIGLVGKQQAPARCLVWGSIVAEEFSKGRLKLPEGLIVT